MSTVFKIGTIESVSTEARLLIEVSQAGLSFVVIDNGNECVALYSRHFANGNGIERAANELKQLVVDETILQEDFKSTAIVYAHPHSVMVPSGMLPEEHKKDMLELVHGDVSDAFIRADFLFRQYIHNIYPVPKQADAVVSYLFSSPVSTHLYSLLPDMYPGPGNRLHCIFYPSSLIAMLVKEGNLQATQSFAFKTPEDAAYHLLQFCDAFEMDTSTTTVQLNGMIEKSSNLYAGLYKYFLNIEFATLPDTYYYPEEIYSYPAHYFSHLFAASSCV